MNALRAVPRTAQTIEQLREQIRKMEAQPSASQLAQSTGIAALNRILGGGIPVGTVVELIGPSGSGKTSIALKTVAGATQAGRLCAYVDMPAQLYAPAVAALGVQLSFLLVLRPRLGKQALWAAVQLLRSGQFSVTVLDLSQSPALSAVQMKQLQDAAAKSQSTLVLLTSPLARASGSTQLLCTSLNHDVVTVECVRSRRMAPAVASLSMLQLTVSHQCLRIRVPSALPVSPPLKQASVKPFVRPQSGLQRNGLQGVYGQRPGRDVTMPNLFGTTNLGG
jgi:recombination protein RecA